MESFERRLAAYQLVGIDTSIFIYQFERHPRYHVLTTALLNRFQSGLQHAVVSTIALMELTVHPWREGRADLARQYEALLLHFPNLDLVDVTRDVARQAAQLRARYQVRPADALHVATAIVYDAEAYITNDLKLARVANHIPIVLLDDFIEENS
ncbi:MAG: type II toxin-antitoxin system VapC family toxin [Anaerolineae bacterium]|nr:type II toxin-antitoxin system VapC family toxin [Anaerolineae bacterium]